VSGVRTDNGAPDTVVLVIHVSAPTATLLTRFDGDAAKGRVTLHYALADPAFVAGVNVYRSDPVSSAERRLTPAPIPTDGRADYEFVDDAPRPDMTYYYRLGLVDRSGQETRTAVITIRTPPLEFAVDPPHPNPARSGAAFGVFMPQDGAVQIRVYDVAGRQVGTVFTGQLSAGDHALRWDGRGSAGRPLAGGVYRLVAEGCGKRVSQPLVVAR